MNKKGRPFLISAIAAFSLAIGLQSCKKDSLNDTEKKVVFTAENLSFRIPVTLKAGETSNITSFMFRMNMDSFVKSIDPRFDTLDIRSVRFRSCEISLDSTNTADNFRNLHTWTIGLKTEKVRNITRIASVTNIPDTVDLYTLDVPKTYDVNLNQIFMADTVYYQINGNVRRPATKELGGKATITYDITIAK